MDGEARWATVHGVAKSRTRLSDFTFHRLLNVHICVLVILSNHDFLRTCRGVEQVVSKVLLVLS